MSMEYSLKPGDYDIVDKKSGEVVGTLVVYLHGRWTFLSKENNAWPKGCLHIGQSMDDCVGGLRSK